MTESPPLGALPVAALDLAAGAALYRLVAPSLGLALAAVGLVLLFSVVHQGTRAVRAHRE